MNEEHDNAGTSIVTCCWYWTLDYKLKKILLSTEMSFCGRAVRTSRLLKVINKVIREKIGSNMIMERMQNRMLKQYGHVVHMKDNR